DVFGQLIALDLMAVEENRPFPIAHHASKPDEGSLKRRRLFQWEDWSGASDRPHIQVFEAPGQTGKCSSQQDLSRIASRIDQVAFHLEIPAERLAVQQKILVVSREL